MSTPDEYDVDKETDFNREKLRTAIPHRLQELLHIITTRKDEGKVEAWFAGLVHKLLLSVDRVRDDLLKTMGQKAVSGAAWNARNLLELWVWLKYCAASRENARRFYEDALRDMKGITEAVSKLHAERGMPNEFEAPARVKLAEVARENFGLDSVDNGYLPVAEAAKAVGESDLFGPMNKFLSKFAHPTAGLVIGIMHQYEAHRGLQATMTTMGVYFAGECTNVLGEIVARNMRS